MNGRPWTTADTDLLLDLYGHIPAEALARRMGRTREALKVRAVRLGINQRQAFLTGRDVARLLGVDSHRVAALAELGLLAATRSSVGTARGAMWRVELAALERFLRAYPAWYDARRVADEPWRTIARSAHADAILTTAQAARLLGVNPETVRRHCERGWLAGELLPVIGGRHGAWRLRRSALAAFRPRSAIGRVIIRSVAGQNARARAARPRFPVGVGPHDRGFASPPPVPVRRAS